MPRKGKSKVTAQQRHQLAAGRLAGKTTAEIAAETGLAKNTVAHQLVDSRTLTLIQRFKERDGAKLGKGWTLAVNSILADLRSKDPEARRQGRRDLLRFLGAGDPPLARLTDPAHDLPPGDFLLEEALLLYRKIERGEG